MTRKNVWILYNNNKTLIGIFMVRIVYHIKKSTNKMHKLSTHDQLTIIFHIFLSE
jgi:hypothetical protein